MGKEQIGRLREKMEERGVGVYVVPSSDFHASEYSGDYFRAREFLTGFTGSAGTAVVTRDEAGLWTDGRYFIQAAAELEGSGVTLYRMGQEGVPTMEEFVEEKLGENGRVGFDGRVVSGELGEKLLGIARKKGGDVLAGEDLVGEIWEGRPPLSTEPAYVLEERYAGEPTSSKIARVREKMREANANAHIIAALDDVAWILNLRGNDVRHFPVALAFLAITPERCVCFLHPEAVSDRVRAYLEENRVEIGEYEGIYDFAAGLRTTDAVLMDRSTVNYRICQCIESAGAAIVSDAAADAKGIAIIDRKNPSQLMKAVKNPVELDNLRKAHVKDGVAFTKFMHWLKTSIGKEEITEIRASDYLEDRRKEQEHFLDISFDTISAYGPNAAMMHYSATEETNAVLRPEGFLLVDSGGHYREGSTDITRTMALGPLTIEEKRYFTAVARANINLAAAKFLHGCTGQNLDILAREPLWEMGMDYQCGTGHGVGYLLNIHEAPNGFRWKIVPEREDSAVLEEGMVTTDEPGVYIEGKLGIRTENELICRKAEKNEYGQFMEFEVVTYAPIDLDAILPEEMTGRERKLLNDYHRMVWEKLSPYLSVEEREWLKDYTREI